MHLAHQMFCYNSRWDYKQVNCQYFVTFSLLQKLKGAPPTTCGQYQRPNHIFRSQPLLFVVGEFDLSADNYFGVTILRSQKNICRRGDSSSTILHNFHGNVDFFPLTNFCSKCLIHLPICHQMLKSLKAAAFRCMMCKNVHSNYVCYLAIRTPLTIIKLQKKGA